MSVKQVAEVNVVVLNKLK